MQALVLDPNPPRGKRLRDEIDGPDASVNAVTSVEQALERLAWPGIDCLVVRHDPGEFDGAAAAAEIRDKHPTIPVVAVSTGAVESNAVDEVVAVEDPDAGDRVAAAVREFSGESIQPSEYETDDPTDPETINVDMAEVDRLLEEGIDHETLVELKHKSALFDELMDSLPVHLYVKDREGRHRYTTAHFPNAPEWFIGQTDPEIGMVTDSHERRAFAEDRHVVETGESILNKVEYLPMRDEWNLTSKVPWHGPDGDVVGLFGITWEITERMERQQQIRRQNERLDRFAEMVSHDLETPLSVARMHLDMARRATDPGDHLDEIEAAIERMGSLIDDVFELARQGQQVVDPSPVDLDSVVEMTWASMDVSDATVETVDRLGRAMGDQSRLRQLFANLFRNSVEHGATDRSSPGEGVTADRAGSGDATGGGQMQTEVAVTIRVGRLADGFYVEDDGTGLPETEMDPFEAGSTTDPEGTGLGLSIVREITLAHGWTVEATTGADGGARFEFTGVDWAGE